MSIAGVHDGISLNGIVGHLTSWECGLVNFQDRKTIEPVADVDRFQHRASLPGTRHADQNMGLGKLTRLQQLGN
jgi:hypothetical protein